MTRFQCGTQEWTLIDNLNEQNVDIRRSIKKIDKCETDIAFGTLKDPILGRNRKTYILTKSKFIKNQDDKSLKWLLGAIFTFTYEGEFNSEKCVVSSVHQSRLYPIDVIFQSGNVLATSKADIQKELESKK
jgi:hypothetical protein